jgi:hypothetical protein
MTIPNRLSSILALLALAYLLRPAGAFAICACAELYTEDVLCSGDDPSCWSHFQISSCTLEGSSCYACGYSGILYMCPCGPTYQKARNLGTCGIARLVQPNANRLAQDKSGVEDTLTDFKVALMIPGAGPWCGGFLDVPSSNFQWSE